jgi:hypothetical protein
MGQAQVFWLYIRCEDGARVSAIWNDSKSKWAVIEAYDRAIVLDEQVPPRPQRENVGVWLCSQ